MLVLSRAANESLLLCLPDGSTIKVIVVRTGESRVRLGIEADESVRVYRGEMMGVNEVG